MIEMDELNITKEFSEADASNFPELHKTYDNF